MQARSTLVLSVCDYTKEETILEETQTTVQKETSPPEESEPGETVEIDEAREPTEQEIKIVDEELQNAYAVVLEQYRQTILMDSDEFIELYWNEVDFNSSIALLRNYKVLESLEAVRDNFDLPTLESEYPYVNRTMLNYLNEY